MMSAQMANAPLASICRLVTDGTHDSPRLLDSGVPFIKGKHISSGRIAFESCDYISQADHAKAIERSKPERGDTLFSNIGSVGDCAFVDDDREFSIKNVALFKPDLSKIEARYLYYLLQSPDVRAKLLAQRQGAAQPFISLGLLRQHEVTYHARPAEQRRIASILGAYDDLIEVNRRRIALVEEMPQRLFEEWFVHFRYPGHEDSGIIETRDGPLPEGWQVVRLDDIYETSSGGTPSRKCSQYYGGEIPWIKTKELLDGPIFMPEEYITEEGLAKSSAKVFPSRTVLVAMYGANIGQLGVLLRPAATNQACCAIISSPSGAAGWSYAYLTLRLARERLISLRAGAAQQNISQAIIRAFPILRPAQDLLRAFEELADPILSLSFVLHQQNRNLSAQRDLLLPRLISGELSVSSAERELEAVA